LKDLIIYNKIELAEINKNLKGFDDKIQELQAAFNSMKLKQQ
jgi:hypothetical protein